MTPFVDCHEANTRSRSAWVIGDPPSAHDGSEMLPLHSDSLFAAFSIAPAFTRLDRHSKGGDSALQHVEAGSQLRDVHALDYFFERPFDALQDRGDKSYIKRHRAPFPQLGSMCIERPSRILFQNRVFSDRDTRTSVQTATSSSLASEILVEAGFEKAPELGCCPELRNRVQVFECGRECVRQAPDGTRFELVVLRVEIQIVHTTREVPRNLQFAFDERLVDDHLGGDV